MRLSSADTESARTLAAQIGRAAVVADGNRDALQGAGAVILALRFTVLKSVIDEIAGPLAGKVVVVPSNPLTADAHGNVSRVLPKGQSSGKVVAGWLPAGARVYDFWLGGKGNFAADRAVAEQVAAAYPDVLVAVRAQRASGCAHAGDRCCGSLLWRGRGGGRRRQLGRAGPVRQRNCSAPTSACAAAPRRCAGSCSCRKRV